jgi:hypothetical protein
LLIDLLEIAGDLLFFEDGLGVGDLLFLETGLGDLLLAEKAADLLLTD